MIDKNAYADPAIDGERTIASVTADKGCRGWNRYQKITVSSSIAVIAAGFAFLNWSQDGAKNREETTQIEDTRIRTTTQFQPAELNDPAPLAKDLPPTTLIKTASVGPIERVRQHQQAAHVPTSAKADQLLLASRRATLIAYSGNREAGSKSADHEISRTSAGQVDIAAGQTSNSSESLATVLKTTSLSGAKASVIPEPHLTLTQGTVIPCNLDTAMDSTLGGMVRCTVTDDIFGTTGTVVLLEKGTKIVGEYRGGVRRGNKRLFVIWTRAETPKGVLITLGSPATDSLGRTGFDGVVDTQFWTRFSGTILLSIINDALAISANQADDDLRNTRAGVRDTAAIELENTINVPVILRKPQGEEVAVMVARDLDFSSVYQLKAH